MGGFVCVMDSINLLWSVYQQTPYTLRSNGVDFMKVFQCKLNFNIVWPQKRWSFLKLTSSPTKYHIALHFNIFTLFWFGSFPNRNIWNYNEAHCCEWFSLFFFGAVVVYLMSGGGGRVIMYQWINIRWPWCGLNSIDTFAWFSTVTK